MVRNITLAYNLRWIYIWFSNIKTWQHSDLAKKTSKSECRVGNLRTIYLGLPLGGRLLDCNGWDHVVKLFRARLSLWKVRRLFMGDRLTLIKSIFSPISIYSLLVRIIPVRMWNTMHELISRFLRGSSKDIRKTHLVDWKSIMWPSDKMDLRLSDLLDMNAALMVKLISNSIPRKGTCNWEKLCMLEAVLTSTESYLLSTELSGDPH